MQPLNTMRKTSRRLALSAMLVAAGGSIVQAHDARLEQHGTTWTFGTAFVEKTVVLKEGKFFLQSFKTLPHGLDLAPQDGAAEFAFSPGDTGIVTSVSGDWQLVDSKRTTLKQGERQLDITLQRGALRVIKSYIVYPGSSIIREWLTFSNAGTEPAKIHEPAFLCLAVRTGNPSAVEFHWMTGGENNNGSWKLIAESLRADKPRTFDSYESFPFAAVNPQPAAGDGAKATPPSYGPRAGSASYAPWNSLYSKDTKQGVFIGWDYFGHWASSFRLAPDGSVAVQYKIAGHKQTLAPGASFTTPKAFVGLYRDDLDNAGNECLDWQYRYLWDYTREPWFPAIRMLGYWMKGTGWGQPGMGWSGGKPDWDSTFRKVFRVADLMRAIGADVYHRDWGWWDKAGDWNGPDFRSTITYLRKYDMGQLIYAFLYTVAGDSKVAKEHPDWLLEGAFGLTLDMSKPEVVEFMKGQLDAFVERWGNFEWRNDSWFTVPRNGDDTCLLGQDEGLRKVIRDFLDKHPLCAFQAVNGGGNYGGYDYVRYASAFSFSDGAVGILRNYYASLLFPPDKLSDIPDVWNPNNYDKATWRGLLCINFDMTGDTWDRAKLDGLRELTGIYHYLQKHGVVGRWVKVYRPTIEGDPDPTMYFQRLSQDRLRGIIIPKRPAPGPVTIKPKGLLAKTTYTVSFHESDRLENRTGNDLMENGIRIEKMAPGELVYLNLPLHPGSKLDQEPPAAPKRAAKQWASNMGYPGVELAWAAAKDNNWIACYEIWRNDACVDKVAKGTYYFDHSAGADLASSYAIRAVDGAGNVSPKIIAKGPASTPATVYDDAPGAGLAFTGEWKHESSLLPAHAGTISSAGSKGAAAELAFDGKHVLWFSKLGADCGQAAVSIDGGAPHVVDTYSADDIWGVCVYQQELPVAGRHTIRIEVLGKQAPNAKGTVVYIDGIQARR